MGTYAMDTDWLRKEFPLLFGPTSTIPTLVVHGDKKTKLEKEIKAKRQANVFSDSESISELENSQPTIIPEIGHIDSPSRRIGIPLVEFPSNRLEGNTTESPQEKFSNSVDGENSLETQLHSDHSPVGLGPMGATRSATKSTAPSSGTHGVISHDANRQASNPVSESQHHGKNCHFTSIQSNWKKTGEVENRGVSLERTRTTIETKRGVHHPKFMILFETSGSVVIVVSTANLVQTKTVEGSWVQRFSFNKRKPANTHTQVARRPVRGNDFGPVLQDFLQKLDESAATGDVKIHDFLSEHLSFPLTELAESFLFHRALVHLVPVVPGDFSIKSESYGRLRVKAILGQAREQDAVIEHKKDLLVVQPTSFGGNWKQNEMADMVRSYLNLDKDVEGYWDDEAMLERMSILWPSRTFMENIGREAGDEVSMDQVERIPIQGKDDDNNVVGAKLFLSSHCFNSCEVACLSRMSRFHWSDPPQRTSFMIPHFKSVCRVVRKPSLLRSKHGFDGSAKTYFSWFLMTSACLSHGAQGQRDRFSESSKNTIRFANFELGILFTSRVKKSGKVLYAFQPQTCSCRSLDPTNKLIHLPVPFSTQVDPYIPRSQDGVGAFVMQETPFLHQVEPGTRCVGNMMLTPYGMRMAKKPRIAT
jgi:Tyrosyl-DNA phosphodiesterase